MTIKFPYTERSDRYHPRILIFEFLRRVPYRPTSPFQSSSFTDIMYLRFHVFTRCVPFLSFFTLPRFYVLFAKIGKRRLGSLKRVFQRIKIPSLSHFSTQFFMYTVLSVHFSP